MKQIIIKFKIRPKEFVIYTVFIYLLPQENKETIFFKSVLNLLGICLSKMNIYVSFCDKSILLYFKYNVFICIYLNLRNR